jgi:hypothetical protein
VLESLTFDLKQKDSFRRFESEWVSIYEASPCTALIAFAGTQAWEIISSLVIEPYGTCTVVLAGSL